MKPVIGLTGGIGSGKSTAAARLGALGAAVVDTDEISRELTARDGAAMRELRHAFGERFVTAEGALDRAAMRTLVFEDPSARARLEAILHPAIRARADAALQAAQAPYAIIVVPLLFETRGYLDRVARTLVVDCPEALQASRASRRSSLPEAEVRRIMAAQWPRWRRLQMADDVLWNGGEEGALAAQCERLHAFYLGNAGVIAPQSGPTQRGAR
ncbi:MAG TPA: dephospho-CoA kinase [Usitatibacter sp.]|nr:dephospho-CoA kinase [Usitatibacter sp.]